jgi:hypothetical protein
MIIVGSVAGMKHKCVPPRKLKDVDVIGEYASTKAFASSFGEINEEKETAKGTIFFTENMIVELEDIDKSEHSSRLFSDMQKDAVDKVYASAEWLYFFKLSHRFKKDSPHFWKTVRDIFYMRSKGITLPNNSEGLMKEREELTYTNKLPKLNVKKTDFFKEEEVYWKYEHDDIHVAVKLYDKPAYTYFLKDGEEVMTDKNKFFSLPKDIQLASCCEEAITLTAERSLIPFDFRPDPDKMFLFSLMKVCTSITSGYFREFSYDNIYDIIKMYDQKYKGWWVDKVKEGISNGSIREVQN